MPSLDQLIDETSEGKLAFRDGVDRDACPHPPGTALGNAWCRGWDRECRVNSGVLPDPAPIRPVPLVRREEALRPGIRVRIDGKP